MQIFIKKYKYILGLILVYFILRLINLTIIPIFNDEAIYLDWGWRELHRSVLFYSLLDAKQPFLMWLFGISEGFFNDQLFAGRVVSVIAGFFTLLGLYLIGKKIFNEKVGLICGLFYIVIPLFSFFDRQALMESGVAATEIWIVYLFLRLLKKHSIKVALALGVVIGIGFFIKSTVVLVLLSILIVYLTILKFRQENKFFLPDALIAIITSQIILLPLYLQSQFWQTLSTNDRYSMGFNELIQFPITTWVFNAWAFLQIAFWHLTPFVFIVMVIGIIVLSQTGKTDQKALIWIFLMQVIFFIFVAKHINPRYTMPILPLSLLFVASFAVYYKKWSKSLIFVLIVIPLCFLYLQLFQPYQYFNQLQTVTSYSQKDGYVTSYTAGYAVT